MGDAGPPGLDGAPGAPGERGPEGPPGKLPIVKFWLEGSVSYEGDVVAYGGACYQALKDTAQAPGGSHWICVAAAGRDAKSITVCNTYDSKKKYEALALVACDGASFLARYDDPGPCPGDGWQMVARQGSRGVAGEKGERGPKGDPGASAPTIRAWKIDRKSYSATPIMSDGREGPALELRILFKQFQDETT
jgi:hypothetical protein